MSIIKSAFKELMKKSFSDVSEFPWEDKRCYADWLAQTHYYVCHSTRLLTFAASYFGEKDFNLHRRFIEHSAEEKGHEYLASNDLKALKEEISKYPEHAETAAFYQRQYFLIERVNPITFFGYILCLEGIAVDAGEHIYERISKAHGPKASNFMRIHAGEDPGHLDKAFANVDDLQGWQKNMVIDNLEKSMALYSCILRTCSLQIEVHQDVA